MLDAHINGESPRQYHISNLIYHILTVISLFYLLLIIGIKRNLSFFLALLFSVHPLFTDAIVWIVGRGDILAGLFGALAFILFVEYCKTKNIVYFILHSVSFGLALFSKEISVVLPLMMILYYRLISKNRRSYRELVPFFFPWIILVLCFFYLRSRFLNSQDIMSLNFFITNLPQIPVYFAKLFLPFGLSPMPVYSVLFTAAGLLILVMSGVYILRNKSIDKMPVIFGILWFLAFIVPGMFLRISLGRFQFEYLECRAYLPSVGIFIALGFLLNEIIKKDSLLLPKLFIPVSILFMVLSYIYSDTFAGPLEFYSAAIKSNPDNAYALCSRGCLYSGSGNLDQGLSDLDNSIMVLPTYSEAYYDKGAIYNSKGDLVSAERYYSQALKYDTLYPSYNNLKEYAFINLSSAELSLKQYYKAIDIITKGLNKYPDNCSLHNNLGLAYFSSGNYNSALKEYNKAISSDQTVFSYFNNRGMANFKLMNFIAAKNDFDKALDINPEFQDALINRGITRFELNDYQGTVNDLSLSIRFNSRNGIAWYFRGLAYSKLNMTTESEANLKMAGNLGVKMDAGKFIK